MEKAILDGDLEKIELLLEEGADPNGKSADTQTPYLFLSDKIPIIKLLLEYGADITATDENGFTIQDYNDEVEAMYTKIIVKQPKFVNYKYSRKQSQTRNKTRRVKRSQISS